MTNEEAKVFLDNLKICIDEHPVVADWLVEIADRKTEPQMGDAKPIPLSNRVTQIEPERSGYNLSPVDKDINVPNKPQTDCGWK